MITRDPITYIRAAFKQRTSQAIIKLRENIAELQQIHDTDPTSNDFFLLVISLWSKQLAIFEKHGGHSSDPNFITLSALVDKLTETGRNGYRLLANRGGISSQEVSDLAKISSLFADSLCLMRNVPSENELLPSISLLNGSSNCSSTVVGPSKPSYKGSAFDIFFNQSKDTGVTSSTTALSKIEQWRIDILSQPANAHETVLDDFRIIAENINVVSL